MPQHKQRQKRGTLQNPVGDSKTDGDMGSPTGMKLLATLMRLIPSRIVYWIALIPVVWYYLRSAQGRTSTAVYQRMLGLRNGPWSRFFFGLSQARAFSHVILDNMYLGLFGSERFHLEKFGTEVFLDALDRKKGLILLSAHVGNWHLAVNFLWNTNTHVHLVIDDVRQSEVRRQMDLAKEDSRHLTMHDASKGHELIFELRAALSRGEVVILAGDRVTGRRRTRIPFLGGEAWFPTTAFSLARTTGASVCTAFVFRTGMMRYECYGLGPYGDKDPAGVDSMVRQFADHLESYIRQFPKQWFNFFDFWND